MSRGISIIIPNYNGRHLLEKNLPAVFKAKRDSDEIIVVDDASTDESAQFVKDNHPEIKLICLNGRQGFVASCNCAVKNSRHELIYLLNSDVEVTEGCLEPLAAHFVDESVFAVSSAEILNHTVGYDFNTLIALKVNLGLLTYSYQSLRRLTKAIPVPFAHGGHAMFDKKKFVQLNMFDQLFRPFNREDWDISYRAWKSGWKILLEPNSLVYHQPGTTITKLLSAKGYRRLNWKNHFLFFWKDITSLRLIIQHLLLLPLLLIVAPLIGKAQLTIAFFLALKQLPEVLRRRRLLKSERYIFSDQEIIGRFKQYG